MKFFNLRPPFSQACAVFVSSVLFWQFPAPVASAQDRQRRIPVIDIREGLGATNRIGRDIASAKVRVTDSQSQNDAPIPGAVVTFEVAKDGVFVDGSRSKDVETDAQGEASLPSVCPTGPTEDNGFEITATTTVDGVQDRKTVTQTNQGPGFSRLALNIVQGSGVTNYVNLQSTGAQRPTDPAVQVTDENNQPLACAEVSFQAPAVGAPPGPGGAFAGGERTVTMRTGADGRATGADFRPNGQTGEFSIAVSAGLAGLDATSKIAQTNKATSNAISVVKGSGGVNDLGHLATESVIRVWDEFYRQPIPKADVTFELTDNGLFLDGSQRAEAETDANGEASPPAICPLGAGPFPLAVTATSAGEQLKATIEQQNREPQFSKLILKPVQGENAVNDPKLQKATEPIVKLTNEDGGPVACAEVTFQLPKAGAGGFFPGKQLMYQTRTGADGQATGAGLVPNAQPGKFEILVTAALPPLTGGVTMHQQNKGGGHTGLIVALLLAGAGGGACAVLCKPKPPTPTPTPPPPAPVSITAGSGTIGHP
jgi:hypothetical protein